MGRLREYFKTFFGSPQETLPPNELPREIHEDFYQQFGHNFESREWPDHPIYERHYEFEIPEHDDVVILEGGDTFREMESMFENFFKKIPFTFHSPPEGFFDPRLGMKPSDDPGQQDQDESGFLRDKMLKQPDSEIYEDFQDHDAGHGAPGIGPHSWFGGLWKSPFQQITQSDDKIDKDLDSEVESGNKSLDDILSQRQNIPSESHKPTRPRSSSSSSSFSQVTTMDSKGRTESRTTRQDSSGREEVTVTRKIGNQAHIAKSWKNQDGSESTGEKIVNIDEGKCPRKDNQNYSHCDDRHFVFVADKMSEFDQEWSESKNAALSSKDNDPSLQDPPSLSSYYDSILDQIFPRRR